VCRWFNSAPGHHSPAIGLAIAALFLAVSPASGAGAADWSKAQPVTVVTTESKFTPHNLVFQRGVAYRLHVENRGKEMHEFNAADLFKSSEIGNPEALNADKTEIVVHPGEAKDLLFMPKQAGHFRLVCPDHDWDGMTGKITVK
jgi:uncharacterized cupredoxin-like copper-binding protein